MCGELGAHVQLGAPGRVPASLGPRAVRVRVRARARDGQSMGIGRHSRRRRPRHILMTGYDESAHARACVRLNVCLCVQWNRAQVRVRVCVHRANTLAHRRIHHIFPIRGWRCRQPRPTSQFLCVCVCVQARESVSMMGKQVHLACVCAVCLFVSIKVARRDCLLVFIGLYAANSRMNDFIRSLDAARASARIAAATKLSPLFIYVMNVMFSGAMGIIKLDWQ